MRIYKIDPGSAGEVEMSGAYECWITGLDCPQCDLWSNIASRYPTVECASITALGDGIEKYIVCTKGHVRPTGLVNARKIARPPMTVDEYKSFKASLEPVLGMARPIFPGTSFESATAVVRGVRGVRGQVGDFIWGTTFSPFVRELVFKEMREGGFLIAGARANLTFKQKRRSRGATD